jgi:carboxyl-terminal processing protease
MTLTSEQKRHLLSKIDRLVQEKFYDPTFNGNDWHLLVSKYREQIINSSDTEAFEDGVTALLSELKSSGTGLLGPHTKITPRNSIAASFRRVIDTPEGERWVFQDVQPGGVAERAGIKPADVLLSIDGKTIQPPEQPLFEMNDNTAILISRNGNQRELRFDLKTPAPKYRDNPYTEPDSLVANVLPDSIGHLKVALFPGKIGIDFANKLDSLFDGALRDSKRLLVDLRGNPGGGVGGMRLMSYFTPACQPIGYSFDRRCFEQQCNPEKLPRFGRIPKSKWAIPLLAIKFGTKKSVVIQTEGRGARKFHGKIVLLVNEHSSGAAEMVAQFAQENHFGTIVGMKTSGRLAARSAFKIGSGYRLTLPIGAFVSWRGTRIEGKGIEPDVQVDWSFPDAVQGRDSQFERALAITNTL